MFYLEELTHQTAIFYRATISSGGVEDTRLEAKDTKKKSEAKDSLSEDRPSRSQGQECSRPRTQPQVFSKKKGASKKFFRQSSIYTRSQNFRLRRPKPQITCNDLIKNLPVGTLPGFCKGRGLKLIYCS